MKNRGSHRSERQLRRTLDELANAFRVITLLSEHLRRSIRISERDTAQLHAAVRRGVSAFGRLTATGSDR
jgi:hypothetical protein